MTDGNYLLISDLQIPYEAAKALEFCIYLKKYYKVPDENVICVGDEVDEFHGSDYPKGADYPHTPSGEIEEARDRLKSWYRAFPKCKVAISNHGLRWEKKASQASIPSQIIKSHREVFAAPPGWTWHDQILVKSKHPFRVIHGCGYSGKDGHRNAAMDKGLSTAIGHLHAFGGTEHIATEGREIWAMNTGCLISVKDYAFKYGKDSRMKPTLGAGVVVNKGSTPFFLPYNV